MAPVRVESAGRNGKPESLLGRVVTVRLLIGILVVAASSAMVRAEPGVTRPDTTITDWTVLPVVFHTPETGIGGGIV